MAISVKAHRSAVKERYSKMGRLRKTVMCPPLHFAPEHTHLDIVIGALSRNHPFFYKPAFESSSLQRIQEASPPIISLRGGGSVRCDTLLVEREAGG